MEYNILIPSNYLRDDTPTGGKTVLTITDSTGKQVRQLDASSKAGVHRTP